MLCVQSCLPARALTEFSRKFAVDPALNDWLVCAITFSFGQDCSGMGVDFPDAARKTNTSISMRILASAFIRDLNAKKWTNFAIQFKHIKDVSIETAVAACLQWSGRPKMALFVDELIRCAIGTNMSEGLERLKHCLEYLTNAADALKTRWARVSFGLS